MQKVLLFIALIAVVNGLDSKWKLLWSDEFNGNTLDNSKWTARTLYYSPTKNMLDAKMVSVADGNLVIKSARNVNTPSMFDTGFVDTAGKSYWTYGRFEVRAKLPGAKGMWPAHWLLSETKCWPYGMEIDILELPYGLSYEKPSAHGTIHYGENCGIDRGNGSKIAVPNDFFNDYHIFAAEWFPGNITFYLDDTLYHVVTDESLNGRPWTMDTTPHYFILNTFIGAWPPAPDNTTIFPQYHYIDHVKVFGWQPCVVGCGDHGVCNQTSGTCMCDSDFSGTYCEFSFAKSYTTAFSKQTEFDSLIGNVAFKGDVVLTVNATGCPTACVYPKAQWSKNEGFGSGNFTFIAKTSPISGTAVFLDGIGGDAAFQGFRITLTGNNTNRIAFQSFGPQNSYYNIKVANDISTDYHTYTVSFLRGKNYTLFVDGIQIYNFNGNITTSHIMPKVSLQVDAGFGENRYTQPISVSLKSFNFVPVAGVKLPRPMTTTTATGAATAGGSTSATGSTTTSVVGSTSATSNPGPTTAGTSKPSNDNTSGGNRVAISIALFLFMMIMSF